MSERGARNGLTWLEAEGLIVRVGISAYSTVIYDLVMGAADFAGGEAASDKPSLVPSPEMNGDGKSVTRQEMPPEATRLSGVLSETVRARFDVPSESDRYRPSPAWDVDIEKLHRLDGRSWEEIEACITWLEKGQTRASKFWRANIRSAKKLREKFDTMREQARQERNGSTRETSEEATERRGRIARGEESYDDPYAVFQR